MKLNKTQFHSGRRLALFRIMKGFTQEQMPIQDGFPKLESRGYRDWESKGIPDKTIKDVADFFKVGLWAFVDENVTEQQIKDIALYPEKEEQIKEDLLRSKVWYVESPSKPTSTPADTERRYPKSAADQTVSE